MARHCFVAIPVVGWAAVKKVLSLIACFIIGVSGLTACYVYARLNTPGRPLAAPARIFISPGSTLQQTAQMLVAEGILASVQPFRFWAQLTGKDRSIQSGEYILETSLTPRRLLETLIQGQVIHHMVTIPEGLTLKHIAKRLEARGFGPQEQFLSLGTSPQFLAKWDLQEHGLEGYLYPDTYFFSKQSSAADILGRMVTRLSEVFTPAMQQQAQELGFSQHEVLTLASLVEKETGAAEERPLIAGVFHNRLRQNIPLQCDPTVIYGIPNFDGNLTRRHLRTPTPYNTYLFTGLPPGPIANPGLAAIQAVLAPAKTNYLYFVARGDGTHVFSTRLADHNRAVRRFQKRGSRNG